MSDIVGHEFADDDINAPNIDRDDELWLYFRYDLDCIYFDKSDVEAMAKHFGIIE